MERIDSMTSQSRVPLMDKLGIHKAATDILARLP